MKPLKTITEMSKIERKEKNNAYLTEIVRGIHERLDGITKRLEDQHAHQRTHAKALDRLERERQAMSQNIRTAQGKIKDLKAEVEVLDATQEATITRLTALEKKQEKAEGTYRQILEARLAELSRHETQGKRLENMALIALAISIVSCLLILWGVLAQ